MANEKPGRPTNGGARRLPHERLTVDGHPLLFPRPDRPPVQRLIGQDEIVERALAAWSPLAGGRPLHFLLTGPPGVGKNALVYALGGLLERDVYVLQGHEGLQPEDLCASARMRDDGRVEYVASPLAAAMERGGICLFDEIDKAKSEALAPLAPVLDDRRTLQASTVGATLVAHPEFLFCAARNDEDDDGVLPPFLAERLLPVLRVPMPPLEVVQQILADRVPPEAGVFCDVFADAVRRRWPLSPRVALASVALAHGLCRRRGLAPTAPVARALLEEALALTAGDADD